MMSSHSLKRPDLRLSGRASPLFSSGCWHLLEVLFPSTPHPRSQIIIGLFCLPSFPKWV